VTDADTLCRSTSKRITTTAFHLKDHVGSSRERTSVQKESRRMFQVERMKVVNGTINQIYNEVQEGKVDSVKELRKEADAAQVNLTTLRIKLNSMSITESEGQHNEDS